MKIKGFTRVYTDEDFKGLGPDEMGVIIDDIIKEDTKNWTAKDKRLIDESMKNIADRPIWDAIYQARKWAFLEARASTVMMETEEERKEWFDKHITTLDDLIKIKN